MLLLPVGLLIEEAVSCDSHNTASSLLRPMAGSSLDVTKVHLSMCQARVYSLKAPRESAGCSAVSSHR
jgi:hypothetical protein